MHKRLALLVCCSTSAWIPVTAETPREAISILSKEAVRFEPAGTSDSRFIARGLGYEFLITGSGAAVKVGGRIVRLEFEGAGPARLTGGERLRTTTNVLRGNDRSQWRRGIPNYASVVAHDVYPGIDVAYHGQGSELEYDLVVHPGADVRRIRLRFDGGRPSLDSAGNLVAGLIHKRPVTFQTVAGGTTVPVNSRFRRNTDGTFGFSVGRYDRRRELVIDPQLTLSAYLGGSLQDIAVAVGHDRIGFLYVGGTTYTSDLVASDSAFRTSNTGSGDLFVAKIDPNAAPGAQVVYTTYIGGSGVDQLNGMAVDAGGTVYLTGSTTSPDFPLGNAAQSTLNGTRDAFVLWLDPSQTGSSALYYATYLGGGGDDAANGIAVDASGRIAVTGATSSTDFPASGGYLSSQAGSSDAFVALFDTTRGGAGTLVYSTYLGGTGWDAGRGIATAPDGTLWVTGATYSGDFPMTGLPYQSGYLTGGDAFVTHLDPNVAGSSSLLYSTYLGGASTDEANKIFVDAAGRVIVTGFTLSTDFPVTAGAAQKQSGGGADAFVAVLKPGDPASQLIYSTYLGGSGGDEGYDVTADASGNIYVAGLTKSADFPVTAGALQSVFPGGPAGFVVKLNTARGGQLDYSSFVASDGSQTVYGIDVDAKGTIYAVGFTSGPIFDALGGAVKTSSPGDTDGFLIGFNPCSLSISPASADFPAPGGAATIAVTASAGCSWTSASSLDWITVSPANGTGSAQVTLTTAPNTTGSARSGTITLAGRAVAVTQSQ